MSSREKSEPCSTAKAPRKRSASSSSDDSDVRKKRRSACSKDKRKKSKQRSSSSSSSSSSASSRDAKAQHATRSKRSDFREQKNRNYENGRSQKVYPPFRDYRGYKGRNAYQDNPRKRGNFGFRPYKHYGFHDRGRREPYNSYQYNRYNNERKGNRPFNYNNRGPAYDRSRSRSNQEHRAEYQGSSSTRNSSSKVQPKYTRGSSIQDKVEPKKEEATDVIVKIKDKKKSEEVVEKTESPRKKSKRKRLLSSSSSSSVSSSSSDTSTSSSSSSNSSSSNSHSSSSSTDSSEDERKRKKAKRKAKKLKKAMKKRRKKKKLKKKLKKKMKKSSAKHKTREIETSRDSDVIEIPRELSEKAKAMAPMTKEEWEKKQNIIRRIYDETTGRYRLIKGDGEVLEEIVSRDRHKEINKQATKGDGEYFQSRLKINA